MSRISTVVFALTLLAWPVLTSNNVYGQGFIWARQMGGTAADIVKGVALDEDGNVYTVGVFILTADFDPGPGTFNLTASAPDLSDVFISKLDAAGNFVWAKQLSAPSCVATCVGVTGVNA